MINGAEKENKLDKSEYKLQLKQLEKKLASLQLEVQKANIPVVIVLDGFSASGKGTLMKRIVYPLDPRLFKVYTTNKVFEENQMRPFLWNYFNKTPLKGQIAIFDRSWARLRQHSVKDKWNFSQKIKDGYFSDINNFERQLTDDAFVLLKFFLVISKDEQTKRFKELAKSADTAWRVDKNDWDNYEQSKAVFEEMLEETNKENAPWHMVNSNDHKFATIEIFKHIIKTVEAAIEKQEKGAQTQQKTIVAPINKHIELLSDVDLTETVSDEEYKKQLDKYQKTMSEIGYSLYAKRQSVIMVYEGWDAAGKGGNIKRVTEQLDPRGYEVVPIAAPTKEELDHHYLWRFYKNLPKDGHVAIFDRSWYGRVLVERIEGYSDEKTWRRAYNEINEMEKHFDNHGVIMFKFWLQVDKEEQLARFNARQENPAKQYKITDDDWRNREKWDAYETAVNEMLQRTSTDYAPWTIIESNDKKIARLKTLEIVTKKLEFELLRK